jgi:hypothetical protein
MVTTIVLAGIEFIEFTANEHPPDLAGTSADLVQLGVAEKTPGWIFVDVSIAAKTLDCVQRHFGCSFGCEQDSTGTFFVVTDTGI